MIRMMKNYINSLSAWLGTTEVGRYFLTIIIIPLVSIALYLFVLAPDRYESSAAVLVKESGVAAANTSLLDSIGINAASVSSDEQLLQAFVVSPELLLILEEELGIKAHYAQSRDFLFGLQEGDSLEDFIRFYRKHVMVDRNVDTGLLSIRVQAYEPEFAKQLADAILANSEAFVNEAGNFIARHEMQFALSEIERNQTLLKGAKSRLLAFQNEYNLVSPDSEGQSLISIAYELEAELARTQAELSQTESYLNADAPQVQMLKNRVKALGKEIHDQKQRITGPVGNTDRLNQLGLRFQDLTLDVELAMTLYTSALNAYEVARLQAGKQLKHLVVAGRPQLPEEAIYPKKVYWCVTWFLVLGAIFGLVRIAKAAYNEHRD